MSTEKKKSEVPAPSSSFWNSPLSFVKQALYPTKINTATQQQLSQLQTSSNKAASVAKSIANGKVVITVRAESQFSLAVEDVEFYNDDDISPIEKVNIVSQINDCYSKMVNQLTFSYPGLSRKEDGKWYYNDELLTSEQKEGKAPPFGTPFCDIMQDSLNMHAEVEGYNIEFAVISAPPVQAELPESGYAP